MYNTMFMVFFTETLGGVSETLGEVSESFSEVTELLSKVSESLSEASELLSEVSESFSEVSEQRTEVSELSAAANMQYVPVSSSSSHPCGQIGLLRGRGHSAHPHFYQPSTAISV
jgi:hypothetical protein